MKARLLDNDCHVSATSVAPEDLRPGDFVAILSEIVECPSFLWMESIVGQRDDLVRLCRLPTGERPPLKIKAICLPFVFVRKPWGAFQTVDIRLAHLGRLEPKYARMVWKALKVRTPAPA